MFGSKLDLTGKKSSRNLKTSTKQLDYELEISIA